MRHLEHLPVSCHNKFQFHCLYSSDLNVSELLEDKHHQPSTTHLQHLLGVVKQSLEAGTSRVGLQDSTHTNMFWWNLFQGSCVSVCYSWRTILAHHSTTCPTAPMSLLENNSVFVLTLMNSTFSRSEACWSEQLIRWRGWSLPPGDKTDRMWRGGFQGGGSVEPTCPYTQSITFSSVSCDWGSPQAVFLVCGLSQPTLKWKPGPKITDRTLT